MWLPQTPQLGREYTAGEAFGGQGGRAQEESGSQEEKWFLS